MSIQIENLNACMTYQVFINTVNEDDIDGKTASKSGTTLESSKKIFFH